MTTISAALPDIPWRDIPPRALVITRLEGDKLDTFVYALRDHVADTVRVVPMNVDAEVLVIDEETMRLMGWVRAL